jgi:hypothetical protein
MITILTFLAANKTIIIGAAVTVAELGVIYRNYKKRTRSRAVSKSSKGQIVRDILWSANPINLFKKG